MTPACKSNTILQEEEQEVLGEEADGQAGAGKCRTNLKHLVVLDSRKMRNQTKRDMGANLKQGFKGQG